VCGLCLADHQCATAATSGAASRACCHVSVAAQAGGVPSPSGRCR
jgi:hypothetical protein